jgi:hypothetical protein
MKSPKSGAGHEDFDALLIRSWAVTRSRDDVDPLVRVTITVSMKTLRRMAERAGSKRLAKFTRRGTIDGYNAGDGDRREDRKGFRRGPLAARGR